MDEGDASDETGDSLPPAVDIPSPAPGFRRSPALLHQLTFLVQPPYVNYVVCGSFLPRPLADPSKLMRPAPLDDMGVTIPDICGTSAHSTSTREGAEFLRIIDQVEFLFMRRRGE